MAVNIFVKFIRFLPHSFALALGRLIGKVLRLILWRKVDRAEARCVKALGVGVSIAREIINESGDVCRRVPAFSDHEGTC